jgi:O-antigen/teichoic acid export membrane protein
MPNHLFTSLQSNLKQFLSGESRTIKAKKNIIWSFVIKGASILISLSLVPLTLDYLSPYEYGVWLTLSSILTWINFFDIGLTNGLRNKLAETFAAKDQKQGQIYVSTSFFLLTLIMLTCFLLFLIIQPFINWSEILNVEPSIVTNLNSVIILAFAFFCLSMVLKLLGTILIADQQPAFNDLITLIGSALSLVIINFLIHTTSGTLNYVILTFTVTPVLVLIGSWPIIFYYGYSFLRPSIRAIRINCSKELLGLGIQFFIIQISSILIFSSSNIIIAHILSPDQVTPYNIVFKYFSFATLLFNIILTPMWSATTDAYAKGDYNWIKRGIKNVIRTWLLATAGIILMIVFSGFVYKLWIGEQLKIPFGLSLLMGIYSILLLWSVSFSTFLFGIGKLRLQLINIVIVGLLFVPLSIWLIKSLGINGIIVALCLTNLSGAILNPIQFKMILSGKATGIWNK